ncbi:single-strand DNA-binding protein [Dyadobacter jejuensis]|uniref:Single-stranded DNA-binding protein n=1 Tax=Dyadobacter jejuensis TaxID=1082580 RepID=A0A316ARY0_9BACT|nr:single-stranded DNA-binding protein [Dyadobacter jejuensis]PWJ60014.1 single-strand DNA-binding protein [Dyadobacter jejuensis]
MNTVKLMGNVGKEIQIKELANGKVANFSLATNESYINKNKEEVKTTSWHHIVAYGKLAEHCDSIFQTGKFLVVEGKINYREYQNKDQQTVKVTEIIASKVEEYVKAPAPQV